MSSVSSTQYTCVYSIHNFITHVSTSAGAHFVQCSSDHLIFFWLRISTCYSLQFTPGMSSVWCQLIDASTSHTGSWGWAKNDRRPCADETTDYRDRYYWCHGTTLQISDKGLTTLYIYIIKELSQNWLQCKTELPILEFLKLYWQFLQMLCTVFLLVL